MKVALDVMGGDHGPPVLVRGALRARRELQQSPEVVLYGDRDAICAVLKEEGEDESAHEIVHTTESIDMQDSPAAAVKRKKDAPIVRAMLDLKEGKVEGVVSAGSTGAMVASALVHLGRLEGVQRPAIATWFPGKGGGSVVLDVGANSENKAEHLAQFAIMGRLFAEAALQRENPRVALLNIGEESSKGSEIYVRAHALLQNAPVNFVGNIEGQEILKGRADVIVCDGFTGNVVLKLAESMIGFTMNRLLERIRANVMSSLRGRLGVFLMRKELSQGQRDIREDLDYAEHGGAPLLGVNGTVIISHGKSNERAIRNAIRNAVRIHELRTIEQMADLLKNLRGASLGA